MHTETKQEKDEGARAWHVLMMSQSTKEGGMGIYKRGFLGIMREVQRGITHDVTFRILILVLIMFGLKAKIVDVETTFLYGNIEEEIFMKCPLGVTDAEEDDIFALH